MKSILVIGVGSIGERHLRCFQTTSRCEVALCEPNETLAREVSARYGCRMYGSVLEALNAAAWDGAVICTPAHTHIPIALQCLEKSIHLLIEKPLSTSLEGIDALATKAAEQNVVVRVAYVLRSISVIMALRETLRDPRLGNPRHIIVTTGHDFAKARPAYASTYYARRSSGGGCIQDALTHTVHTVEWLAGPIERVFCDASHEVLAGVDVEDTVNMTARIRGGALVSFTNNQFQVPGEQVIAFHAAGGSARAELFRNRIGVCFAGESDWTWTDFPAEERDAMFIRQANSFLDAMEGRNDELSTLEAALQTLKVNLAALQSADLRREIAI